MTNKGDVCVKKVITTTTLPQPEIPAIINEINLNHERVINFDIMQVNLWQ